MWLATDAAQIGDLWGRKLADVAWTAYGANDYIAARGPLASLEGLKEHPLIGWEDCAGGINAAEGLTQWRLRRPIEIGREGVLD
jgi:hypothetical protein